MRCQESRKQRPFQRYSRYENLDVRVFEAQQRERKGEKVSAQFASWVYDGNMRKILCILSFFIWSALNGANVGLLIMATGKYSSFVPQLIDSAEEFFCPGHRVTYFVFTDAFFEARENVCCIYQPRLGWPFDTMLRSEVYYNNQEMFLEQDYLFACDADMLFVSDVGDEILGERTAVIHPGFFKKHKTVFSYETNLNSLAGVLAGEGTYYFAGGFLGGTRGAFLSLCKTMSENIRADLHKNIIAIWHDESHWNRYCINHPPTVVLTPSYVYPSGISAEQATNNPCDGEYSAELFKCPKKIVALSKNHAELRE